MVILTFVVHKYMGGNGNEAQLNQLPKTIVVPLEFLSEDLGTRPLGTYASTVLWNARPVDRAKGWSVDNVSTDFAFTGSDDEILFYAVRSCLSFEWWANEGAFYWKIRPSFPVWQLVEPRGAHYAGVDKAAAYGRYVGISSTQTSLFQALDLIFDILHGEPEASRFRDVRPHMPLPHQKFLEFLEVNFRGSLKKFVDQRGELIDSYNRCLRKLIESRSLQWNFAQKYAMKPASLPNHRRFRLARHVESGGGSHGARGTPLLRFLSQIRDDTKFCQITA